MSEISGTAVLVRKDGRDNRKVIFAASLGGLFEFYDFFLYGALAPILSAQFFSGVNEPAAFIFALMTFAAGFVARPFGGVLFGRIGDMVGRKYTFLATMILMGAATFLVGLLPGYKSWGIMAPIVLISLRLLQGLAIGGEYGGAAIFVAEHSPPERRGFQTSWLQATAALGLLLSLLVIFVVRTYFGEQEFLAWGWRIPFLLSLVLLAFSVWIRMSLGETPLFLKMKAEGKTTKAPLTDTFSSRKNVRSIVVALFGLLPGTAVIQFTGLFYSLLFLTQTLKLDAGKAGVLLGVAILVATPLMLLFGALSDRVGRKPVIIGAYVLSILLYFPLFNGLTTAVNPALARAIAGASVVVVADSGACSFQFNPIGTGKFRTSCDIAKSFLAKSAVPYSNEQAKPGEVAYVLVGGRHIDSYEGTQLSEAELSEKQAAFVAKLGSAIVDAGYPRSADPEFVDYPASLGILIVLVGLAAMGFAPLAATLVELFPIKVRYTALSLPYHLGVAWFGGFLPTMAFAIVAATGNIYDGLWYPVVITAVSLIVAMLFVPETKGTDITL
jgi:hypothetical protein